MTVAGAGGPTPGARGAAPPRAVTDAPPADRPVGVLAVNLGSPDAPDAPSLRRYLEEFLSDPRVVDWPRWLWLPILKGIILRARPRKSAALYQKVWTSEGSPLIVTSRQQAVLLQDRLGDGWRVVSAMRYGRPSIADGLRELRRLGCETVVSLPLFPQYAEATTGSVVARVDEVAAADPELARLDIRHVPPYPTDEGYLEAVAASVRATLDEHRDTEHIVFSFHGIPARVVEKKGDPYKEHCESTALALALRLELEPGTWTQVYQSKFGPERWLQPYATDAVPALASKAKKIIVACPGFIADCLETVDEIGNELAEDFEAAGGEKLVLAPCVNTRPEWITAMVDLVKREVEHEAPHEEQVAV